MDDTRSFREVGQGGPSRPPLGAELLPPVEEPSGRFIVQLFVVPMLIVLDILGISLTVRWLMSTSLSPDQVIESVDTGPSVARWQRARDLAEMFVSKRYANVKHDNNAASHLAQILDREIDASKDGRDSHEAS